MNKKRYLIIIALIIFVFLAVFTFANPFNDGESGKPIEEIEEDVIEKEELEEEVEEKVEEEEPVVVIPQYNSHGVSINKPQVIVDNSYEKALEAVIKSEITLALDDLEEASKLVELVKDETKREELDERLSSVIEIIDLTDSVDTLVKNVNAAEIKDDMISARNYAKENDVINRIDKLSNELIKDLLIEKLSSISKKLEDTKNPIVNIEDGAILDSDTKIIVTDDSDVTIKLNDEERNNNEVVGNGSYILTATDASFNTTTVKFIVDTEAPKVTTTFTNGVTYISGEDLTEIKFNVYKEDELKYTYESLENNSEKSFSISKDEYGIGKFFIEAIDETENKTTIEAYVAEDLKSAFDYTDTIVLHDDIEITESLQITSGQNKVINLNGNKISGRSTESTASNLIKVATGASLKLTGEGEISFTAGNPDTDWGTTGTKPYPGYANNTISNSGKLIIDGPTIINNTEKGGASYVIDNYAGADLQILSGTIIQTGGDIAIRLFANSATVPTNVTVNGGSITGNRAIWIQLPNNDSSIAPLVNVTITGGTLTSTETVYNMAIYSYSFGNSFANTNVTITGGIFNGGVAFGAGYYNDTENVTITGGVFNSYVGRYTATGWVSFPITW